MSIMLLERRRIFFVNNLSSEVYLCKYNCLKKIHISQYYFVLEINKKRQSYDLEWLLCGEQFLCYPYLNIEKINSLLYSVFSYCYKVLTSPNIYISQTNLIIGGSKTNHITHKPAYFNTITKKKNCNREVCHKRKTLGFQELLRTRFVVYQQYIG